MEAELAQREVMRGAIDVTTERVEVFQDTYGISPTVGVRFVTVSMALAHISLVEVGKEGRFFPRYYVALVTYEEARRQLIQCKTPMEHPES